jgi:hypothetical protein
MFRYLQLGAAFHKSHKAVFTVTIWRKMDNKLAKTITVIVMLFMVVFPIQVCSAQDSRFSYQLLNQIGGDVTYELNVLISENLLDYYTTKSHIFTSSRGFSAFVTPYALQPIADRLWEIYDNEEDYANGVLMIVHQITYVETTPVKYPVETMVEGQGDCDLFSFIAASVLEAGGFDVVLLYYEDQVHMNIGISLSNAPAATRDTAYYVTHEGTRYYVAECTGGNWKDGWRVGECPTDLKGVSAEVITLENSEKVAPGQVSASFTATDPSLLSLEVSPIISIQNTAVTISGQLDPDISNENVTLYARINGSPWSVIGTVSTQANGHFEYLWTAETAGAHTVRASWSGNEEYAGSTSPERIATVMPLLLSALVGVAVVSAIVGVVAVLMAKHTQQDIVEQV